MDLTQVVNDETILSYLIILLVGSLATDIWRWAGALIGARIDADSETLKWVRAVSNALVAGLVGRMLIFPAGALAASPLSLRLGAFAIGIVAYVATGKNFAIGVFAGFLALIAAQFL